MRKLSVLLLVAGLAIGLAVPAEARTSTYSSVSANAFWYVSEQLPRNVHRDTTWYVGVYQSSDGTWSDVYRDVTTCRTTRRGESCSTVSAYGFSDLADAVFLMDGAGLSGAHLDATYDLQEYDEFGNPVGDPTPTRVVVDWAGEGDVEQNHGKYSYCDADSCTTTIWDDAFRAAEADGTVDDIALGQTYDAYLSSSTSTSTTTPR